MNISTQAPIRAYVTIGGVYAIEAGRRTRCWPMHSGQRWPTGVAVMHSGQIGRPQFEQCRAVSRSGCR